MTFSPYGSYYKEIRKICVLEILSAKNIRFFQFIRDQEVTKLIQELSKVKSPVKLNEKISGLMNNSICKIAFGKSYEGKQFQNFEFEKGMDEAMAMMISFWFADCFPFFGKIVDKLSGMQSRLETCFCDLDTFFERVIDEHLDPERPKPQIDDIIDILIDMSRDDSASIRLTRDHMKAICFDMLVGATNTSTLTTIWAMSELVTNPRIMKKIQAEIRSQVGRKPMVEAKELEKLKYLEMVVKETLRLHTPATLLLPRETMRKCTIGGYDIEPKTRILVNAWALGRDPGVWDNPEEFHPERFENSDINFKGNNYEFVPFGAGRRICPGIDMGALNITFTLANLLHSFDWELPNGTSIEDISMEEEVGLTVHKKIPLVLVPIKHIWEE